MPYIGTWTKLSQGDALKRSSLCASTLGPSLYIFGGELHPRQPRDNAIHRIPLPSSPSSVSTTTLPVPSSSPSPRVGSTTVPLGDKLYLFSGRGGTAMAPIDESGGIWVYTPSPTPSWALLPPSEGSPVPCPRSYHALTGDEATQTLYLHAGCPEKGRLADFWAFDVPSRTWRELPSAPGPARGGTSIAFAEGRVWRLNGFDGQKEIGGKVDFYDTAKGEWGAVEYAADGQDGPEARSVGALVPVKVKGSTVLVTAFGERDPSSLGHQGAGKMLGDAWGFAVRNGKWSKIDDGRGARPEARGWFDADVVDVGGREHFAVVGGLGETNERLDDAWLLSVEE